MFASKTETAIGIGRKQRAIGKKLVFINNDLDNRYTSKNFVSSHNGTKEHCLKVGKLMDLPESILEEYDTFIIEESQFFTDLLTTFQKWNKSGLLLSKMFVVTGLASDFSMKKFGCTIDLIPMADSLQKLSGFCSICKDGTAGPFTKSIFPLTSENNIVVGAAESFTCVCRKHF